MKNRPFRIGRSKTGLGLFATEVIKKNTRIFEYTGKLITNDEANRLPGTPRYLYDISKTKTLDGSPRSNIGRYANHSCKPNSVAYVYRGQVFVKSLRTIQPEEEILYDYGKEYFDAYIGKDKCACEKCSARRAKQKPTRARARA